MLLATVDRVLRHTLATITLGVLLLLAAALAGVWTPLKAVACAAAVAVALPTAALVAPALVIRAATRTVPVLRRGCRCAGLLGLGTLATGLTTAVLPLVDPPARPALVTVGLGVTTVLYLAGLLDLPGAAASSSRLRLGLDGMVTGFSLALAWWLLAPGPAHPIGYFAAAVTAGAAAVTVTALRRTSLPWLVAARCAGGVLLAVLGLALLAVAVVGDAAPGGLLAAAMLVVVAPPLVWAGARRIGPPPETRSDPPPEARSDPPPEARPDPPPEARPDLPPEAAGPVPALVPPESVGLGTRTAGGFPPYALPLALAMFAMIHHLTVADPLNRAALVFGTAVVAILLLRELSAAAERRRTTRRLAGQAACLVSVVTGASDAVLLLGPDLLVWRLLPAPDGKFGPGDREVTGRRFTDLLHPDDVPVAVDRLRALTRDPPPRPARPVVVEARMTDRHGAWCDTESTISDLRGNPDVGALLVQVREVGRRRALEHTLHRLISRDELTGLPRRRDLLRAITARQQAAHRGGVLLVIELTGFCALNDQHGPAAGDRLLVAAARRLIALVGGDDLVCRLGERTFAVVTGDGPVEAYTLGFRLLVELGRAYPLPGGPARAVPGVGLATLAGGQDADEVLRQGHLAVRHAAELNTMRIDWYDESLEQHLVRQVDLERHLPGAAGRGELDLVFQPVLDLGSGDPAGVEALLRWRHPMLGTVLPREVLPVSDKLGLAEEIGQWVLHAACRQVGRWRRSGHDLWLAINVSAGQLTSPEFVAEVAAALSVHQSPPERLTVEISELEVAEDPPAVSDQLSKLRELGVRTALEDFGTDHTDLARLRRLPLDVVKLCPAVTTALGAAPGGPRDGLPEALLAVAQRFQLTAVAVGIETQAQRERVHRAGCQLGQGFLLAPPAPAELVTAYLQRAQAAGGALLRSGRAGGERSGQSDQPGQG